ncbi:MAG: NADH:flavin oxidoreductase [Candidatus Hydrogenedentota bacterium]|nr:MAG: NADH:flavin oxidoreductase [Candidatus Hydrogenedentota bacterium]
MNRNRWKIFSPGRIGSLELPNRLVRSATWDPSILRRNKMNDETIALYRRVASGGVGLIITGDFSALPAGALVGDMASLGDFSYDDARVDGYDRLIAAVRKVAPDCKIVAQISAEYPNVSPSGVISPLAKKAPEVLSVEQIKILVKRFVVSIEGAMNDGFDGIQFHAAHGGLLSQFMSPYTNRRTDAYGGSVANRVRLIGEIVSATRTRVGDFPILIKLNCTDYVDGGINIDNFPEFAMEVERTGVDAIEVSGGMRDCLVRSEDELGFPPVYPPESQTRIVLPERQSYFLKYVECLDLEIPVILVGGNRDVVRLENIIRRGKVDFISLCRPLISEPDLPNRWRAGQGKSGTDCTSCNSCIYDQIASFKNGTLGVARCLLKEDPGQVRIAREWLSSFAQRGRAS